MAKYFIILFLLFISCGQKKQQSVEQISTNEKTENLDEKASARKNSLNLYNGESNEKINLEKPTVLIQELDSLEIEQIKKLDGEDNFYTASDDLMYYNSKLIKKMDSLKIDVIFSDKDTLFLKANDVNILLNKNSKSTLYNYYYFDGQIVRKTDLFKLLDK